jgi:hypothetical protein
LAGVLLDLSMTASLSASLEMGAEVIKSIAPINKLHKMSVEQASFIVLKSPDIPSILVETGFISNPGEARKLRTSAHQKKMAGAMFKGVSTYFRTNHQRELFWPSESPKRHVSLPTKLSLVIPCRRLLSGFASLKAS